MRNIFRALFKKNLPISVASDAGAAHMDNSAKINFDSDRPIRAPKQDRLGFSAIADTLAVSVLSASVSEGLVIGIEGAWGSGKSSILNLLCGNIEKHVEATVIRFDPWIVGDRDSMVAALMANLSSSVLALQRSEKKTLKSDTAALLSLSKKLRKYGANVGRGISPLIKFASICGLPYGPLISEGLDAAVDAMGNKETKSLAALKEDLVNSLRELKHRFVVVIDDIDRLEPAEAAEVMRLVRAVGDFPNIIDLMCYDRDVLAHSLENAIGVKQGKDFLQKIIQISFPVPRPEEFDLRHWFSEDCADLYYAIHQRGLNTGTSERLATVCDAQGQQLQTPRDVGHVLNALRLIYPPVAGKIDFADLCWLQIIRLKNEALYKWIEEYLTIFAAIKIGSATTGKTERASLATRLKELFPDNEISISPHSLWYFGNYIPGVEQAADGNTSVLGNVGEVELAELEENARLGSPHHYRLYFAFAQPAGTLNDSVIKGTIDKAGEGKSIVSDLEQLIVEKRPQGGSKYEVFLDRIKRLPAENFSKQALVTFLEALGDTVDKAQHNEREPGFFGQRWVWRNAREIFASALKKMNPEERAAFLLDTFTNRKSIGWLTAEIIGSDSFAHGRVGDKSANYGEPLLTKEELDAAIAIMFARLAGADRAKIAEVPNSLAFFYRWKQAGGEEDIKRWMAEQSQTDKGFLKLLNMCRGWVASGKEVRHPLNKRDLEVFMDFDGTVQRLKSIAGDANEPDEHRKKAENLLKDVRLDDREMATF